VSQDISVWHQGGWPVFDSWQGQYFSLLLHSVWLCCHPITILVDVLMESSQSVKLTTCFHLVLVLRMCGAPLLLYALMAWFLETGTTLPLLSCLMVSLPQW